MIKSLGYIVHLYPKWDKDFGYEEKYWDDSAMRENATAHGIFETAEEAQTWGTAQVKDDPEGLHSFSLQLLNEK